MKRNTFCTMKKIRFTLAMMALVLCSLTVNAQYYTFEVDGICYRLTSRSMQTVSVTYRADTCEKYAGDIVIPTIITYNGSEYKVSGITEGAFSGCSELLSITIPDEIQRIGDSAFKGCI